MQALIIDNFSKSVPQIESLVNKFGLNTTTITYDEFFIDSYRDFDCYILSGGSYISPLEFPQAFLQEYKLLTSSKKPILGICLGFEIIADSYGSTIIYQDDIIKEDIEIQIIQDSLLFEGIDSPIVKEAHRWKTIQLGKELIGLAKSAYGYEIITHEHHNITGFQFHPELDLKETSGDEIFKNWLSINSLI